MHPAQASGAESMEYTQNPVITPCSVRRENAGRGSAGGFFRLFCHPPRPPPHRGFYPLIVFFYLPIIFSMNRLNFEDTIFILNMRIRLLRDTLRLNPPPEFFLNKVLDDLEFLDGILGTFTRDLVENGTTNPVAGELAEYITDTEWQFSQLVTEFSINSGSLSISAFPLIQEKTTVLCVNSNTRRMLIDKSGITMVAAQTEPVVTSAEFIGLLGSE
jgi:hypothetical protein